ncbi:CapA family protein [Rarobacter incanus]|uniref:CapA family protein n=1 Tax=Rarobacter incanus TaxID=153494 RepID=UPI0014770311|nr:CapA family protein [Rarobacter incanus]
MSTLTLALLVFAVAFAGSSVAAGGWPLRKASGHDVAESTSAPAPNTQTSPASSTSEPANEPQTPATVTPDQVESEPARFTILAAGDVLIHGPVMSSARSGSSYNFSPLLAGIDEWVQGADLALCHMETPVAPAGTQPSGYPMFGAPKQIVKALAKQGWDGCSTSSNHSVDRGFAGIQATIDAFKANGLGYTGTATSKKEQQTPQRYVLERGGQTIHVSHIGATYGTNGLPVPAGKPWSVNIIDTDAIIEQARRERENGADLVLVSLHFGQEYRVAPTEQQLTVTQELAKSQQVDLVIGHHAHIPQPMTKLAGGPGGNGMWVAYGLGNMLSNQDASCCVAGTESGLMMVADVTKPVDGPAEVTQIRWHGITVDKGGKHHVYPFTKKNSAVGTLSSATLKQREQRVATEVGDDVAEIQKPPTATGEPPAVEERTQAK